MKAELDELAEISRGGASEREIETDVVQIFRKAGWPRSQINQDVAISDRATDKADIVLKLENQPATLVEVKRYGEIRDAEGQVNRYCRLLRPHFAFLTDGARWILYHVGQSSITRILEATVPGETDQVVAVLNALTPSGLAGLRRDGVFEYLRVIEQGFQELSEDAQRRLRPHFVTTTKTLLVPYGVADVETVMPPDNGEPKPAPEGDKDELNRNDHPGNYDPFRPPDLTHTSVKARFGQKSESDWNPLLREAVATAIAKSLSQ